MDAQLPDPVTAVLQELAQHQEPVSSARLCKKLGMRMSTLLRSLAYLGDADIAGSPGLGFVHRQEEGNRLLLSLTAQGRAAVDAMAEPTPSLALPAATVLQPVLRYRDGHAQTTHDVLAQETPIALVYNGISHAVMMATPADLEAFAIGFSLSEGIVEHAGQIYDIAIQPQPQISDGGSNIGSGVCDDIGSGVDNGIHSGIELHLHIHGAQFAKLKVRRRQLAGRTGCGLCGLESLSALQQDMDASIVGMSPADHALTVRRSDVMAALQALPQWQTLNAQTGALHVAAWVYGGHQLQHAMEDVGRHNALDKLIGMLAREQADTRTGWVLMSSRASYELVQKCARSGISVLATVSAPTAMAVRMAQQAGICLIGFVRASGLVVYSFAERVVLD